MKKHITPVSKFCLKVRNYTGGCYSGVVPQALASTAAGSVCDVARDPFPFKFETGTAFFAKKKPLPFPPPFLSSAARRFPDLPSAPDRFREKPSPHYRGCLRGVTNGDDAAYASNWFIAVNDGVGSWSARPGAHAGLWSRLVLHFWVQETENNLHEPNPIKYLQRAYEETVRETSDPCNCKGATTTTGVQLYYKELNNGSGGQATPLLYVTNLGDSQVLVLRPRDAKLIFKSIPQWHWFHCPRQLGTNSNDTPRCNATLDMVEIMEDDIVIAVSDGVTDNLWEHEIIDNVLKNMQKWESLKPNRSLVGSYGEGASGMKFVADELMKAARAIATDQFAESPYMEQVIGEGLAMQGGKLDDISVVAAICKRTSEYR